MKNVALVISIILNIVLLIYAINCANHTCPVVEAEESTPVVTEQLKPTETAKPVKETVEPTSTPAPQKPRETRPPAMVTPVPDVPGSNTDVDVSVPDDGSGSTPDGGGTPDGGTPDGGGGDGNVGGEVFD